MTDQNLTEPTPAVHAEQRPAWIASRRGHHEIRLRSKTMSRALAWALTALVAVTTVGWAIRSWELWGLELTGGKHWLQWLQLAIAIPGILAALVSLGYLLPLAARGWTWRNWRPVSVVFGALVAAWVGTFVAGLVLI